MLGCAVLQFYKFHSRRHPHILASSDFWGQWGQRLQFGIVRSGAGAKRGSRRFKMEHQEPCCSYWPTVEVSPGQPTKGLLLGAAFLWLRTLESVGSAYAASAFCLHANTLAHEIKSLTQRVAFQHEAHNMGLCCFVKCLLFCCYVRLYSAL